MLEEERIIGYECNNEKEDTDGIVGGEENKSGRNVEGVGGQKTMHFSD